MTLGEGRSATPSSGAGDAGVTGDAQDTRALLRMLFRLIAALTGAGLLVITILPTGATRVFSWPWLLPYSAVLLGPICLLLLRAGSRTGMALPSAGWQVAGAAAALTLVLAALASPHRGPSLQWSLPYLSAIAVFFVAFDALRGGALAGPRGRTMVGNGANLFFVVIAIASLSQWLGGLRETTIAGLVAARNPNPLGHPNYTAGLALLMLPWAAAAARRERGASRVLGMVGMLLGLALLFSSGSRGGIIAFLAMIALGIALSPLTSAAKRRLAALGAIAVLGFLVANPRTRAMLGPPDPESPPNISNVQRHAMLKAGLMMGIDRPFVGWGPGTTPLVFPRYRAALDGGAEDVLQLHCLPVQAWAETGTAGVLCLLAGLILVVRNARNDLMAATALGGYVVFSLFDAQLDVPVFGFTLAIFAAMLAGGARPAARRRSLLVGLSAVLGAGIVLAFGRADPTPQWNAEALRQDAGRPASHRAIELLQRSLAINPDQEIAHFNLGWLEVVDDPASAARHFVAAAHLVPDKGGVYFGLGLARLNAGDRATAARAFALEALNDPVFLLSPWWQNPSLAPLRPDTILDLRSLQDQLMAPMPADTWAGRELRYQAAFTAWLAGEASAEAVAAVANTPERRAFFRRSPTPAAFDHISSETLRRERIGYPVLMRNLDLAPPFDAWIVRESSIRASPLGNLWPDKGWVPSPLLIALLDGRDPRNH